MTNSAHSHTPASSSRPIGGILGLIAVVLGGILLVVGFLGGIDAALNGSGSGAGLYTVLFIAGGVLVLGGLIMAIVSLVRGHSRLLSILTIVLALLPAIGAIVLRLAAVGAS